MAFWSKTKKIEDAMFQHVEVVEKTLVQFRECLLSYLDKEDVKEAQELAFQTHKLEGRADDIRRKVEAQLLEGALLASSRGDIFEIVERTDKLANAVEAILDYLLLQKIKIPEDLKPLVKEITDKSLEIFNEVKLALQMLFENRKKALNHTKAIEQKEGEIDKMERHAIQKLFSMDLELADKILVRDLFLNLTDFSDRAEDLSDRIEMAVAQRIV